MPISAVLIPFAGANLYRFRAFIGIAEDVVAVCGPL